MRIIHLYEPKIWGLNVENICKFYFQIELNNYYEVIEKEAQENSH